MLGKLAVKILAVYSLTANGYLLAQDTIKILPLGNSITYDQRLVDQRPSGEKTGYRYKLYTLLTNAGYDFDFIGSFRSGFNYFNDSDNSGFNGINTENLSNLLATGASTYTGQITAGPYLNYYPADIILLEIGTNDVVAGSYSVTFINNILNTVDQYEELSGNPVLVMISTIISIQNYPCGTNPGIRLINDSLKTMVMNRIHNGDKLILTDMECGANIDYYDDMWDKLHPDETGYDKMAQKWFSEINGINTRPLVFDIPDQQIQEGKRFSNIDLNNFVTDSDDSDTSIVWTIKFLPEHLNVSIDSANIAVISPIDPEWNGTETLIFIASDPGKYISKLHGSDQDNITFTVTAVNDAPVISSQKNSVEIFEDQNYKIDINDLNITDPDDSSTNLSLVILPGNNYVYSGTNITPALNFNGRLPVNLAVSDGKAQSDTFEFLIEINAVNDAPFFTSQPDTTASTGEMYTYQILAGDIDEDDVLSYTIIEKPEWLELNTSENILSGIPDTSDLGLNSVTVLASDGKDNTEQSFNLRVKMVTGKREIDIKNSVFISPIPAKDFIIISSDQYKIFRATIYNMNGKAITSQNAFQAIRQMQFNVSDLSPGLYLLELNTSGGSVAFKLNIE